MLPPDQPSPNPSETDPNQAQPAEAQPGEAPPPTPAKLSDELEAEIDDAMAAMEREGSLEAPKQQPAPAGGAAKPAIRGPRVVSGGREHRTGAVVSIGPTDIFVEFGPKELGVVEKSQFGDKPLPEKGDQVELVVNRFDPAESIFICTLPGQVQKADWEQLEAGQAVEARVTGVNKGGLELEVAGHRAFMPASQVSLDRIPDLSVFVGEKIACEVQRVDRRGKGNIVLSRRNILQQERQERAKELRDKLEEGQTVQGTVRKIMPFGAFVDLGGVDGLVHISDMTHERVPPTEKNVQKFVKEGQAVKVVILKINWEDNRISLGMKQLQDDPFVTAMNEVVEGAIVTGRVVQTAEFGAFVEVAPGVQGLVHISELDWRRVATVEEVVKPDEVVTVKVLKIDPETRKVSLSIKQTKEAPQRPSGPGGPGGGKGRGRGRGDRDTRSPEEILKETPEFRRLREKFGKTGFKGGL
ncbi:MAG: S1 RNA-binding domain-containing protein [Phycisphaerales bacterium]|nr:MAG: S1 RNA-binding domain-containing protein [Phycisphaerales bacterium]